jgi:hypothetical protein
VWKSTNYGATFVRVDLPFAGPCGVKQFDGINWSLVVDDIGYVYTTNGYGCVQGIFRSTDGGFNWTNVIAELQGIPSGDIGHITVDPYLPGHMLASFHSDHTCECGGPDIESFDRGTTWRVRNRISGAGHNNWVHFLGDSNTWVQGAPVGEWRTTDAGLTWTKVNANEPTHAGQEILRVGNTYYLGSDAGVLRSTDNGASWTLVPDNSADGIVAVGTDGNGRLFTRTANAGSATTGPLPMLTSTNGTTWTPYNSQTFTNGPKTFSRDSQYLYASMMEGGVWRLPIAGGTQSAMASAAQAPSLSPSATPTRTPTRYPSAPTPTETPLRTERLLETASSTATPTVAPSGTGTPTKTPTRTATPTKTPSSRTATPTTVATTTPLSAKVEPTAMADSLGLASWSTTATVTKKTLSVGKSQSVKVSVKADTTVQALVAIEIHDPAGKKVSEVVQDNSGFVAGTARTFQANWTVPSGATKGTYTVSIGVFSLGRGSLWSWNDSAARFTVN